MTLAALLALARANWRVLVLVTAVLALLGWHFAAVHRARLEARAALVAEQAEAARQKLEAANAADDATRKCVSDPRCLREDDGFKRP